MARYKVGDEVTLPDGTKGSFQGMSGPQKSRRATIRTPEGEVKIPISTLTGKQGISYGQATGAPGTGRAPMKQSAFQKLSDMGIIRPASNEKVDTSGRFRMMGAAAAMEESQFEDDFNKAKGGLIRLRRKGTFKGTF